VRREVCACERTPYRELSLSAANNRRSRCGLLRGWPVLSLHFSRGWTPQVGQGTEEICCGVSSFLMAEEQYPEPGPGVGPLAYSTKEVTTMIPVRRSARKIPSQNPRPQRRFVLAKAGKESDCRIFDVNILLRPRADMAFSTVASSSSIFAALRSVFARAASTGYLSSSEDMCLIPPG
jgi:hypothetical protein